MPATAATVNLRCLSQGVCEVRVEQERNPQLLAQALQALCSLELDQIQDPKKGLLCDGWIPWGIDTPPQIPELYVKKPELRCREIGTAPATA
jgi:hypothetical protein